MVRGRAFADQLDPVQDFLQLVAHDGEGSERGGLVRGAEQDAHRVEVPGADGLQGPLELVRAFLCLARGGDEQVGDALHGGEHHGHAAFARCLAR